MDVSILKEQANKTRSKTHPGASRSKIINPMKVKFIEISEGRFRFEVEGDANATAFILKNSKNKAVKKQGLRFAEPALYKMLESYNPEVDYTFPPEENPCTVLLHKCMAHFQEAYTSTVIAATGGAINPEITVRIILPSGTTFEGKGRNQNLARQEAASKALASDELS